MGRSMQAKSTDQGYGRVAILLHWVSAVLILAMLPLGFLMQDASDGSKLFLYRTHAVVGILILLLTLARLCWKRVDPKPAPPPGLTGLHLRGMEGIHVLLYVLLLALTVSGIVLNIQSGLIDVLRGTSQGGVPEFDEFRSRAAHGLLARVYIGLLVAHIGGVVVHQMKHGHVFVRIGIGRDNTADTAGQ